MSIALHSQSHLGYGSHTNPTVTAPAGITNGDILLLVAVTFNASGTAPTPSPPAGFTAAPGSTGGLLVSAAVTGGDNMRLFAWTKVAASESGNYSVTQAVGSSDYWMGDYTGGNSSTPMASGWTGNSGNSQTSTALGVTTTINGSRVVVVGGDNGDTSNALSIAGSTPTFTSEIAAPVVFGILDGTLTTAGSTGNKTFTNNNYESTYGFVTGMLVLNAAGSVAWPPVPMSRRRLVVPTAKRRAPGLVPAQDAPIARAPRPSQSRAAMTAQPRGKRSLPVPPQVNPPYVRPNQKSSARARFTMLSRGRRAETVPPQPPYPWPNRVPPGRRLIAFVRGRRALGPLGAPDTPVKPTRVPPKIGLRRGRQATIVPAQAVVAPAYPSAKLGAARRLLSVPGHGRRTFPAPAQVPVPPTVPGSRQPAGRRLAALARGRRTLLPLAQDVPSVRPSRAPSRAGLRRARQPSVVPAQTTPNAPAFAPGKLGAARRLLSVPSRGRQTFPAQPQIPVPAQVPGNRWSSGRSKLAARKPGRPTVPVTQATPAPPAWVPQRTSRRLLAAAVGRARRAGGPVSDASSVLRPRSMPPRPLVPRRRSQVSPPPQSIVPPPVVLGNRQPRGARIAALLRTRKTVPVPAQVPVPVWPPHQIRKWPRWGWLRRGGRASPGWDQPEKLRISAVGSTGRVAPFDVTAVVSPAERTGRSAPTERSGGVTPAQRTGVTNPTMSEAEV